MKAHAVLHERDGRNLSPCVPDLPGRAETERRIREAIELPIDIELPIEGLRMDGEAVPEPTARAGTISVPA